MKEIKVFGYNSCLHCIRLKNKLVENTIKFDFIDIESKEGEVEFEKLNEVTKSYDLPQVIVGDMIIVPSKSFDTIEQCFELITKTM